MRDGEQDHVPLCVVGRGRPSVFTEEVADAICSAIAGGESLRKVCERENMPHRSTVLRWMADRPDFRARYALAREAMGDHYFDLVVEAAADVTVENAAAVRAKVDALKWVCARLRPSAYSDKVAVAAEVSGRIEVDTPADPVESARRVLFAMELARRSQEAVVTKSVLPEREEG